MPNHLSPTSFLSHVGVCPAWLHVSLSPLSSFAPPNLAGVGAVVRAPRHDDVPVCQSVGVGGEYVGEWGCESVSRCMWVGEGVRG